MSHHFEDELAKAVKNGLSPYPKFIHIERVYRLPSVGIFNMGEVFSNEDNIVLKGDLTFSILERMKNFDLSTPESKIAKCHLVEDANDDRIRSDFLHAHSDMPSKVFFARLLSIIRLQQQMTFLDGGSLKKNIFHANFEDVGVVFIGACILKSTGSDPVELRIMNLNLMPYDRGSSLYFDTH